MTELRIRRADAEDADAIARLLEQLGYPTESSEVPGRLERLALHRRAAVLLAERDGETIGLATVHVLSVVNRRRDVALLTALVVEESARGTGVGRSLTRGPSNIPNGGLL